MYIYIVNVLRREQRAAGGRDEESRKRGAERGRSREKGRVYIHIECSHTGEIAKTANSCEPPQLFPFSLPYSPNLPSHGGYNGAIMSREWSLSHRLTFSLFRSAGRPTLCRARSRARARVGPVRDIERHQEGKDGSTRHDVYQRLRRGLLRFAFILISGVLSLLY